MQCSSKKNLLHQISEERIQVEFGKLLCGKDAERILRKYQSVIAVFLPEITPMIGLEQHSPYHIYDVWGTYASCNLRYCAKAGAAPRHPVS